jgi:pyruvate-formate lyase-activating enzyme
MANLFEQIKDLFTKKAPLAKGFFTYQSKNEAEDHYRLHLRIEPGGEGVLIVNASTILHLNQSATEMVQTMMQEMSFDDAIRHLHKRFNVPKDQLVLDYTTLKNNIATLVHTTDLDPVSYLGMQQEAVGKDLNAPYRLDCAITYQLSGAQAFAPQERVSKELTPSEWQQVIQKVFDAGIPHILFTGGEPTLREDLADLLLYCEKLGMVTGLLTNGVKLADKAYLVSLLEVGLDHIMLVFDFHDQNSWDTLSTIMDEDIHVTVHLTLKPGEDLKPVVDRLAELKVHAISLSESQPGLETELENLRNLAAVHQMELVWDIPVPYSQWNPIALELEKSETNPEMAFTNLYVEPDGDVLPAQGINKVMGNLLTDAWDVIWNKRQEIL